MSGLSLLEKCKPIIGVVHLPPLPGSPGYARKPYPYPYGRIYTINDIVEYAVSEARKYEEVGFDAVILENYGDKPYKIEPGPEETAAMAVIAREVAKSISIPLGINMLRNAPHKALIAATLSGATIIRANSLCETRLSSEGTLEPASHKLVEEAVRLGVYQKLLNGEILVLADIDVKHSHPLTPTTPDQTIEECTSRTGFPIRTIVITGPRTGTPPDQDYADKLSSTAKRHGAHLFIGSGVTTENIPRFWRTADGFIIGTAAKLGGKTENIVSIDRAKRIVQIVERYRKVWPCTQKRKE